MIRKDDGGAPAETTVGVAASRRRLLRWLWWGLGLAAAGELMWIGASFARPRRAGGAAWADPIFVAGRRRPPPARSPPGGSFYLARLASGGLASTAPVPTSVARCPKLAPAA
jgi:hypothetical protein